jgi:hypothetical protein
MAPIKILEARHLRRWWACGRNSSRLGLKRRIQFLKDGAEQLRGTVYRKPQRLGSGADGAESFKEPLYKIQRQEGARPKGGGPQRHSPENAYDARLRHSKVLVTEGPLGSLQLPGNGPVEMLNSMERGFLVVKA